MLLHIFVLYLLITHEYLQYAGNTQLQACIRKTEKHNHSVDDDLFDLGLSCQIGYFWVVR